MPPCAATVCERVGNTLVMQAVFKPLLGHAERGAQAGAAGTDHDHVEFVVDKGIGLALPAFLVFRHAQPPNASLTSA